MRGNLAGHGSHHLRHVACLSGDSVTQYDRLNARPAKHLGGRFQTAMSACDQTVLNPRKQRIAGLGRFSHPAGGTAFEKG